MAERSGTEPASAPACPYCGESLEKIPARKTKCKACGQFMYVKSTPENRTKRLMTEAQALAAEEQWNARGERISLDRRADDIGLPRGLTERQLADAARALANDPAIDLHRRKMAAFSVSSYFCQAEEERRNWAVLGYRLDLLSIARHFEQAQVRAGSQACPSCQTLHERRWRIADAMNMDQLPNRDCLYWRRGGGCCAFWTAVIPGVDQMV